MVNISRSACAEPGVANLCADLADLASLRASFEGLEQSIRNASQACVVHNAAHMRRDNYKSLDAEALMGVLSINVAAPQCINQVLIPWLPPSSSVIFVGSTLSEKGAPNVLSYVTSKHALAGLMRATCQDLENAGIHCCLVAPGFTDTEMLRGERSRGEANFDFVMDKLLMKRLIAPAEIAQVIYFCALNPVFNGAVMHANSWSKGLTDNLSRRQRVLGGETGCRRNAESRISARTVRAA